MSASLSSLLKSADPDPSAVLAAADAALRASGGDTAAQRAKVVSLLKLDRFEDALRVYAGSSGEALRAAAPFEHAYALYKTGALEQALQIVHGASDLGSRHLEAQASYRKEDFQTARQIYDELWENRAGHQESDLRINRGAVKAQQHWKNEGDIVPERATREDLEVFDTAYNAACGCLARGELAQGEILLKRAKDLCESSPDLSAEDKKAELLPISVQQLFVLSAQGKTEAAEELAKEIAVEDIPDLSTRQVAQVNKIATAAKPTNPYLAQRLVESLPPLPQSDKLFGIQAERVRQNLVALQSLVGKFAAASKATNITKFNLSDPTVDSARVTQSVHYAAAVAQNQLGKMGIKVVRDLDQHDVGFVLVLVQLYMLTKNHGAAIKVMEDLMAYLESESRFHDVRYAPGLVAVLVSLYKVEGRRAHIQEELSKAASHWKRKSRINLQLFHAAGLALLESGRPEALEQAGAIFEAAKSAKPNDILATAGFVAALAPSQPAKVAADAEKLTPIDRLTAGIDAAALEEAGIPQLKPSAAAKAAAAGQKRAAPEAAKPAKKRVRKSRLAKEADGEKKPDPERWLPLRDRSTYKPKGRKGKQKQQALTQGGISKEATEEAAEVGKAAAPLVAAKPGGGGGGGAKKKGKKKK